MCIYIYYIYLFITLKIIAFGFKETFLIPTCNCEMLQIPRNQIPKCNDRAQQKDYPTDFSQKQSTCCNFRLFSMYLLLISMIETIHYIGKHIVA